MSGHGIDQLVVADAGVAEAQLIEERFFASYGFAGRQARALYEFAQFVARQRGIEVFDNVGLYAAVLQRLQYIARSAATRIMIDRSHSYKRRVLLELTS